MFAVDEYSEVAGAVLGVSLILAGHQLDSHGEVFLPKITMSVLSVLSLRQLAFFHLATLVMQVVNLFLVLGVLSKRKSMS